MAIYLTMMEITIRNAIPDDVPLILTFINKKSEFDRRIGAFSGVLHVTEEKLYQTLFGTLPYSYVLFAGLSGLDVGFAVYGFRYSSFAGQPNIWLDDLFVNANARGQGVGAELMQHLAHIAKTHDCTHLGWTADARNVHGLRFYRRLGAEITTQQGDRCFLTWVPASLTADSLTADS
ncbi:MAG: GNAT family N-acetyltransferase [Cyanobacteria bacterium P01_E01_bin.6]